MADRRQRWDTDERGRGVADATAFASAIDELAALARTALWVAEEPELHLLPHVREAIARRPDCSLAGSRVEEGVLVIDVAASGPSGTDQPKRAVRVLAHELVASVAEPVVFVRERSPDATGATVFDVVTGVMPGDGAFATHGHAVRLRIGRMAPGEPARQP